VHSITAPPFLCSAGAFHHRAMVFSFGRRISLLRRILFVRPAHPIIVLQFLQPAGTSHRRATISSLQSIRLPAHSPQNHRFGVGPFGRRIPHRAVTDLVLFHLAGAFPAEPPPIWRCFTWPAHSPPIWSLCFPAHSPPTHRFSVAPFGWRIPSLHHHCPFWPSHPLAAPPLPI